MGDNLRSKIVRRGPLGLSLGDEDAFLTYVRGVFNQSRGISESQVQNSLIPYQENNNTIQVECGDTRDQQEMSKASHMPVLKLKIGSWEKETTSDGEIRLLAKFYYLKRRIVWEILEIKVGRKRKLEMRLDDILNIIPIFSEGRTSILRVELKRVPMMAIEKEPERNKHTIWIPEEDFTGGQALVNMIHVVEFEEGILEKHYEKLLLVEPLLSEITRLNSSSQQFNSSMDAANIQPVDSFRNLDDQRKLNNELTSINLQTPTDNTSHLMRGGRTTENVDFGKIKEDGLPLGSLVENNSIPQSSGAFQNLFMNDEHLIIDGQFGEDDISDFPTPSWVYW